MPFFGGCVSLLMSQSFSVFFRVCGGLFPCIPWLQLFILVLGFIYSTETNITINQEHTDNAMLNLQAPCILYIRQTYRYSPEYAFYIFSQQMYLITFLDFLSPSSFIPPQNVVYFLMLPFLVHKIFTFYINGVLYCECPAAGPKGY